MLGILKPWKMHEMREARSLHRPDTVTCVPPSIGPLLGKIVDNASPDSVYSYRKPLELASASYPFTKSTVTLPPPVRFGAEHSTKLDDRKPDRGSGRPPKLQKPCPSSRDIPWPITVTTLPPSSGPMLGLNSASVASLWYTTDRPSSV